MSEEFIDLELLIQKVELRQVGEKEVEVFPVRMTLRPPGEADQLIGAQSPGFFVKETVLEWRPKRYKPEDGRRMFQQFFPERSNVRQNWVAAMNRTKGRYRLQLRFDADESIAPLQAIPWELLYDATLDPPGHIAAGRGTPFSRFVDGPAPGKTIAGRPLKMLVAVASPDLPEGGHWAPVDPAKEEEIVTNALSDLTEGQVELDFMKQPVTLAALEQWLVDGGYDILHFVGHGRFDADTGGSLLLASADNQPDFVEVNKDVVPMFDRLDEQQPRFIFLASCEQAKRSDDDPFQGLAPSLFKVGVAAVLAMQEKVQISTARAFTQTFYQELFRHGMVDLASNAARSLVMSASLKGSHVPVLFSRLFRNQLLVPREGAVFERKEYEPEMAYIRSGTFLMGNADDGAPAEEQPQHPVELKPYWIGKYPVTVREYARFLSRKYKDDYEPKQDGWFLDDVEDETILDHPVAGVSWEAANAYCQWLAKDTGRAYRLPSEAEWERAARGREGRRYPWGDEWDAGRCRPILQSGQTQPLVVDSESEQKEASLPGGASPDLCYDMVGHVQEWTNTVWGKHEDDNMYPYPYRSDDEREDGDAGLNALADYRVYRGGKVDPANAPAADEDRLKVTTRGRSPRSLRARWRGFRVARNL